MIGVVDSWRVSVFHFIRTSPPARIKVRGRVAGFYDMVAEMVAEIWPLKIARIWRSVLGEDEDEIEVAAERSRGSQAEVQA